MHQPYSLGSHSHVNDPRRGNNGGHQRSAIFLAAVNEKIPTEFAKIYIHIYVHANVRKESTSLISVVLNSVVENKLQVCKLGKIYFESEFQKLNHKSSQSNLNLTLEIRKFELSKLLNQLSKSMIKYVTQSALMLELSIQKARNFIIQWSAYLYVLTKN